MNERPLRLQATDPRTLARTRTALELAQSLRPNLVIRCGGRCGRTLANAGYTDAGLLFTSSWPVAAQGPKVNDAIVTERQWRRFLETRAEVTGDDDSPTDDRHGVIALAVLPGDYPDDYPDLLVRCPTHGDAVLDRHELIQRCRSDAVWVVSPTRPFRNYEPTDDSWLDGLGTTRHTTLDARFGAGGPRPH